MKRLWLFSATAGLLLGSATPPSLASEQRAPDCAHGGPCAAPIQIAPQPAVQFGEPPPNQIDVAAPPAPPPAGPVAPTNIDTAVSQATGPTDATPASKPPASSNGVRIVISIPQQRAYVFDDGDLLATSPVSTGKRGHATPAGSFPILQKKVHHRSNKYANAPMPYMQRLTWGGVALHAGSVPGYPASHGCIRLPRKFAKTLYGLTDYGTVVTVTNKRLKSSKEARALT